MQRCSWYLTSKHCRGRRSNNYVILPPSELRWAFPAVAMISWIRTTYLQVDEERNVDHQSCDGDWQDVHHQMLPARSHSEVNPIGVRRTERITREQCYKQAFCHRWYSGPRGDGVMDSVLACWAGEPGLNPPSSKRLISLVLGGRKNGTTRHDKISIA